MKTFASIVLALAVLVSSAFAKPKNHPGPAAEPMRKIFEVTALSITLSYGDSGEVHRKFSIGNDTKITLDGVPVAARDLRAGMVARIKTGPDDRAQAIEAKDAPTHPAKHRVG